MNTGMTMFLSQAQVLRLIVGNQSSASRTPDFLKALFQHRKHRFKIINQPYF